MYGDKSQEPKVYYASVACGGRKYLRTNLHYYISEEEFYALRSSRHSLEDIRKLIEFPYNARQLHKLVKKLGWDIGEKVYKVTTEYTVNDNFFKVWTRESAWVYGWLLTDGSVEEKSSQIKLMLKRHDKDVLEKIKYLMKFNGNVYDGSQKDGRQFSYLRICRKEMANDLFNLGMARKEKTFNTTLPIVNENVFWDLVRGIFEGDGSIRHRTGNTDILDITICGATEKFIIDLQEAFETRGIFTRLSKNNSGVYTINTKSNADALRLCYFMYARTTESNRMNRKFNVYAKYINTYYDKVKRRSVQCNSLVELARQNINTEQSEAA
jgi:hypothetical protein